MPETPADRLLRENLQGLAATDPTLAAAVQAAPPNSRMTCASSRGGLPVPAVRTGAGSAPLHSLYDPRQEARRLAETGRGEGFLAVLGLGGGYHVRAALALPQTCRVLVIEKDSSVVRALLACVPLVEVLLDPRVSLVTGLDAIRPAVLSGWNPALAGGMRVLALRAWCDQERGFFDAAAAEIQAAVEAVRADYGVQSHFGKRWFANILANLPCVRKDDAPRRHGAVSAVVTAAGPSLEEHASELAHRPPGVLLVATDTSLPALVRLGVQPDAVLSIDCQVYGYHHFLQGLPAAAALYLDLASPPLLARRFPSARFVAGGHPFSRYIQARWQRLPPVDTSGGNVTHAAVTLARELGAGLVTVHGADFSYPGAKPYARGTWLYDFFQSTQCRLAPADSELTGLAVRNGTPVRRGGTTVYTTPLMTAYRQRFQELMAGIEARPRGTAPGGGEPASWREFLSGYAAELRSLPAPGVTDPAGGLWATVLPVAARMVKDGAAPGPGALEEARQWCLHRIARVLEPRQPPARAAGSQP